MNITNSTFRLSPARKLWRVALAGAAALAVPVAVLVPAAPVAAQSQLGSAVEAIRGISTMKADFVQTDRQGRSVSGVMTLKRPGKIRFEYQKDVNMLIVSNGKSLTMVDYDVNQVQRWPIKDSPLGALLDPNRDIAKYGKLIPTGNSDVISVEVRDPKRPEYGVITMIFIRNASAPGGWQLTNWVALDSQNNRTTVKLRNHRYGVAVNDKSFTYRDPRQTTRRPR
ncbi:outer membrane lipoprotein carrier protein LolA [Allopontixanthobacter sp.]|uniref:LolA family protein n=1 Tax=Allopontixanthobacter sp. TaxID=2906452 RepID=UPI002AB87E76|nr:outer membrane lipoprotein carrier protein LolA [Allopontixanthobacter sp.]MDZ4308573.1 outer membrane lipoprotein carrier protein LolA [Allopontixanthobacter sp.]